jgi:hypothetical protein
MTGGTAFALDFSADYRKLERNESGEYQDACDITIRSKPASRCQPPIDFAQNSAETYMAPGSR